MVASLYSSVVCSIALATVNSADTAIPMSCTVGYALRLIG